MKMKKKKRTYLKTKGQKRRTVGKIEGDEMGAADRKRATQAEGKAGLTPPSKLGVVRGVTALIRIAGQAPVQLLYAHPRTHDKSLVQIIGTTKGTSVEDNSFKINGVRDSMG